MDSSHRWDPEPKTQDPLYTKGPSSEFQNPPRYLSLAKPETQNPYHNPKKKPTTSSFSNGTRDQRSDIWNNLLTDARTQISVSRFTKYISKWQTKNGHWSLYELEIRNRNCNKAKNNFSVLFCNCILFCNCQLADL